MYMYFIETRYNYELNVTNGKIISSQTKDRLR